MKVGSIAPMGLNIHNEAPLKGGIRNARWHHLQAQFTQMHLSRPKESPSHIPMNCTKLGHPDLTDPYAKPVRKAPWWYA